jgi:hypothetical protein
LRESRQDRLTFAIPATSRDLIGSGSNANEAMTIETKTASRAVSDLHCFLVMGLPTSMLRCSGPRGDGWAVENCASQVAATRAIPFRTAHCQIRRLSGSEPVPGRRPPRPQPAAQRQYDRMRGRIGAAGWECAGPPRSNSPTIPEPVLDPVPAPRPRRPPNNRPDGCQTRLGSEFAHRVGSEAAPRTRPNRRRGGTDRRRSGLFHAASRLDRARSSAGSYTL